MTRVHRLLACLAAATLVAAVLPVHATTKREQREQREREREQRNRDRGSGSASSAAANSRFRSSSEAKAPRPVAAEFAKDGEAEARLIAVYRLIGQGEGAKALAEAEKLTQEYPNFQLGQLVYGDMLALRVRNVRMLGDIPEDSKPDSAALEELRRESALRLKALRERPPANSVPMQFASVAPASRHAIAIDASRSRLYLFENSADGLHLVADYYVSVGKSGIDKSVEGDMRTPLGVYYITGRLDPKTLKAFYGAGALPINYPNPYDTRRGKTGGGIWLHGTPVTQFARAPLATDGCVVIANPDLQRILQTVEIRTTPVVISERLNWMPQAQAHAAVHPFEETFAAWRGAKAKGDVVRTLGFYAADFNSYGKSLTDWSMVLQQDMQRAAGRPLQTKDLSVLRWQENGNEVMVVTFGEVPDGEKTGPVRRQYWINAHGLWKIFFEGTIG